MQIAISFFQFLADAEIPADPVVALKDNAMKITRNEAIQQVKKMVQLVIIKSDYN